VLTALFGLARLDSTILNVALPLWVLHHTSAPRPLVAAILIVNTCLVILLQVRAVRGSETPAGIIRAKRLACLALIAACLVIGASGSVARTPAILLVLGGTALLTAGELWISAASWSVRYGFAAPHAQGEYGAVFGLGSSAMDLAGPAAVVLLTDRFGLAGWAIVAGAFAVVFVAIRPAVARAAAQRPQTALSPD
jgi:hypothetical protein